MKFVNFLHYPPPLIYLMIVLLFFVSFDLLLLWKIKISIYKTSAWFFSIFIPKIDRSLWAYGLPTRIIYTNGRRGISATFEYNRAHLKTELWTNYLKIYPNYKMLTIEKNIGSKIKAKGQGVGKNCGKRNSFGNWRFGIMW